MNITEFRKKYPQYDDLSDDALARGLHKQHYSDMPYEDFAGRFGVTSAPTAAEPPTASPTTRGQAGDTLLESVSKGAKQAGVQLGTMVPYGLERYYGEAGGQAVFGPGGPARAAATQGARPTPEEISALPKAERGLLVPRGAQVRALARDIEGADIERRAQIPPGEFARPAGVLPGPETLRRAQAAAEERAAQKAISEIPAVAESRAELAKGQKRLAELAPAPGTPAAQRWVQDFVAAGLGSFVPVIATGVITRNPEAALAVMGATVFPQSYQRFRERGRTHDQATIDALVTTAAETLTERVPVGYILTPSGKRWFARWLTAAGLEGAQESISSLAESAYARYGLGDEVSLKQALLEAGYEGTIGAALGFAGAAGAQPFLPPEQTQGSILAEEGAQADQDSGEAIARVAATPDLDTAIQEAQDVVEETPVAGQAEVFPAPSPGAHMAATGQAPAEYAPTTGPGGAYGAPAVSPAALAEPTTSLGAAPEAQAEQGIPYTRELPPWTLEPAERLAEPGPAPLPPLETVPREEMEPVTEPETKPDDVFALAKKIIGSRTEASTKDANRFMEEARKRGMPHESLFVGDDPATAQLAVDFVAQQNAEAAPEKSLTAMRKKLASLEKQQARLYQEQAAEVPGRVAVGRKAHRSNLMDWNAREMARLRAAIGGLEAKPAPAPVEPEKDDILTAITKLGGLDRTEAERQGVDPADFRRRGPRLQPVFRKEGGRSYDDMAQALAEQGYLPEPYRANDLVERVDRALRGNRVMAAQGVEVEGERLLQEEEERRKAWEDDYLAPDRLEPDEYQSADQDGRTLTDLAAQAIEAGMSEDAVEAILERGAIQELPYEEIASQLRSQAERRPAGAGERAPVAQGEPQAEEAAIPTNDLKAIQSTITPGNRESLGYWADYERGVFIDIAGGTVKITKQRGLRNKRGAKRAYSETAGEYPLAAVLGAVSPDVATLIRADEAETTAPEAEPLKPPPVSDVEAPGPGLTLTLTPETPTDLEAKRRAEQEAARRERAPSVEGLPLFRSEAEKAQIDIEDVAGAKRQSAIEVREESPTEPQTFKDFVVGKGLSWPISTKDPAYPALLSEYRKKYPAKGAKAEMPAAEKPAPAPPREDLTDRIVAAARMPYELTHRYEVDKQGKRIEPGYWAELTRDGTTVGKRYASEQEARAAKEAYQQRRDEEFAAELRKMNAEEFQRQADYWLKERQQAPSPQERARPKAAPKKQRQTASLTGDEQRDERLRTLRSYAKRKLPMTAGQEQELAVLEREAKADPTKWAVGDGVGYRVYQQINRGFRIAEIEPTTKRARVVQVADTGLTITGGADRIPSSWVHIGDLVRDRKYDQAAPALKKPQPSKGEAKPEPTAKDKAKAERFRKMAETARAQAKKKLNPAIADQNWTARRSRIAAGMVQEGEQLQALAKAMESLAADMETGTLPADLAGIKTKGDVEILLRHSPPHYPTWNSSEYEARALLDAAKGLAGTAEARRYLENTSGPYTDKTAEAVSTLFRAAKKAGRADGWQAKSAAADADYYATIKRLFGQPERVRQTAKEWLSERWDVVKSAMGRYTEAETAETEQARRVRELDDRAQQVKGADFFPTPPEMAERMVRAADMPTDGEIRILEPSAGKGNILDAIRDFYAVNEQGELPRGVTLEAVEWQITLRELLEAKGYTLVGQDFLEYSPGAVYDRILMNPPFSKNQDVAHIRHAHDLLKPGGRLVALSSAHWSFAEGKTEQDFRDWIDETGAEVADLEAGALADKGSAQRSSVSSKLIVVDKATAKPAPTPSPEVAQEAKYTAPGVSLANIPVSAAKAAHQFSSMAPEERASQRQREFADLMQSDWDGLSKLARNETELDILRSEWPTYLAGYRNRYMAGLSADSRTASSMVTGPSNFPTRRNQKALDTAQRRWEEASSYRERALKAIEKKIRPDLGPISSDAGDAVERLQEKLEALEDRQARMKAVNAAHKKYLKSPESLDKTDLSDEEKAMVRQYKPAYSWEPHPYAPFELTNNNANIKRVRGRIAELTAKRAQTGGEVEFEGGRIVDNVEENRLQIFFDGKPDAQTRDKLKSRGFRWAPSVGAWQRQRSRAANYAAEEITGAKVEGEASPSMPSGPGAPQGGAILFSGTPKTRKTGDPDLDKLIEIANGPGEKPLAERWREWTTDWKNRLAQTALDRFHGLKIADEELGIDTAEQSAYVAARMSTTTDALFYTSLIKGPLEWTDGGARATFVKGKKGLLDILQRVEDKLDLWQAYAVAKRSERLLKEGREALVTPEMVKAGLALEKQHPEFKTVSDEWAEFNSLMLDFAEGAGLINADSRAAWENDDYVPYYRILGEELKAPRNRRGLSGQSSDIRRLRGGEAPLNNILENMLLNTAHLIDASMKNHAMQAAVENFGETEMMTRLPLAGKPALIPLSEIRKRVEADVGPLSEIRKTMEAYGVDASAIPDSAWRGLQQMMSLTKPAGNNVVQVRENGSPHWYEVHDPLLLRSLTAVNSQGFGKWMQLFRLPKRWFTTMITLDPGFQLRNIMRDTGQAFVLSRDRLNPVVSAIRGASEVLNKGDDYWEMMAAGGGFHFGFITSHDPQATRYILQKEMRHKNLERTVLDTPRKLLDAYMEFGNAMESANRLAMYHAAVDAGKSRLAAAFEAKDFLDFSMRGDGPIFQFLSETVPFFNARLQGLYRLGRGAAENPMSFTLRGMAITAATLALWLINRDDERYQELEEWDKDTYWHFWLGDRHFRLPKPFEVGTVFATIPERIADSAYSRGDEALKVIIDRLAWNAWQVFNLGQLPQTVAPIVEEAANREFFTGRPIVGLAQERLLPEAQYNEYTHETAIAIGRLTGLSPARIDHLWRGYTGTMGDYMLTASDYMVRGIGDYPVKPSLRIDEVPVLKSFVRSTPVRGTRFRTEFYDLFKKVDRTYNTVRRYRLYGERDRARAILEDNRDDLRIRPMLSHVNTSVRTINKQMRQILTNRKLTPDQKRERIDRLTERKNRLYEMAVTRAKTVVQRSRARREAKAAAPARP